MTFGSWIQAFRAFLELLGIGLLISAILFWLFPGALLGLGIAAAKHHATAPADVSSPLSPADLAAILLAVATIVLGVVAFFISILAFIGFGEIKNIARDTATKLSAEAAVRQADEIKKNKDLIDKYIVDSENRLMQLRGMVLEELTQGRGLESGQQADAFASAASGNSPLANA